MILLEGILDSAKIMLELFTQRIQKSWRFYQKFGDVFLKWLVPVLHGYQRYCQNYPHAVAVVQSKNFATIITVKSLILSLNLFLETFQKTRCKTR